MIKMKKGISAIIATVLLLLITIALAGSVFVYMSGMLTGKTAKTISLLDASCSGTTITIVISNDGTADILPSELTFLVSNSVASPTWVTGGTIVPHNTTVLTISGSSGTNTVKVISPSNTASQIVYC